MTPGLMSFARPDYKAKPSVSGRGLKLPRVYPGYLSSFGFHFPVHVCGASRSFATRTIPQGNEMDLVYTIR